MSITIDPRRHDAVLFDLSGPVAALSARLQRAGVRTEAVSPHSDPATALAQAAGRLAVRPGRCVVLTDTEAGAAAARGGGFALVVGVDRAGEHLRGADAAVTDAAVTDAAVTDAVVTDAVVTDAVVAEPDEVAVRTGDRPMSVLPNALTAPELRDSIRTRRPAVFFDFDGTLSDIVDDPGSARLVDGAADALQALARHCPVAVLSGRDLADVRERVGLPGIWYAGSHGFELTGPDGTHHQNDAAAAAVPVLADAAGSLHARLGAIPGVVVEHKRFAVAVHYRNAAREKVGEASATVRDAGHHYALRVTTGREVIELRPDIDWDKGRTLRWVIDRLTDRTGALLPIYLGDDITDEDAFDAVLDPDLGGIGIIVCHTDDGDRATAARFALNSPAQVSEFTGWLAGRLGDERKV